MSVCKGCKFVMSRSDEEPCIDCIKSVNGQLVAENYVPEFSGDRYKEADYKVLARVFDKTIDNMRITKRDYLMGKNKKSLWPVYVDAYLYRTGPRREGHTVTITIENWPEGDTLDELVRNIPYQAAAPTIPTSNKE